MVLRVDNRLSLVGNVNPLLTQNRHRLTHACCYRDLHPPSFAHHPFHPFKYASSVRKLHLPCRQLQTPPPTLRLASGHSYTDHIQPPPNVSLPNPIDNLGSTGISIISDPSSIIFTLNRHQFILWHIPTLLKSPQPLPAVGYPPSAHFLCKIPNPTSKQSMHCSF
jgi:hypothetical protein